MARHLIFLITFMTSAALANPLGINVSGKIVLSSATTTALNSADVDFKIYVLSKNNCVLYSESFLNQDLSLTNGTFSLTIGKGTSPYNAYYTGGQAALAQTKAALLKVFSNTSGSIASLASGAASSSSNASDTTACPGSYAAVSGDARKIRIEFDEGSGFTGIVPYHEVGSVPFAMIADQATDADKLGGVASSSYTKNSDLATAVPAAETDPSVKGFAKADVTGGTDSNNCGAGKVLSLSGGVLTCVTDGGGAGSISIASDTVLGGVQVQGGSYVSINAGNGDIDVKDLPISKITALQAALDSKFDSSDMPGSSCAAGEALVWQSPSNTFACSSLTLTASQISDFNAAADARVAADTSKLPLAGGTMTGNMNMGNMDITNVGYIHLQNKAADPGALTGAHNGYAWYNSAAKSLKFYDGSATQALISSSDTCTNGEVLKWNTDHWECAADSGSGGADASSIQGVAVDTTAPATTGQVLRFNSVSGKWEVSLLQAADLPSGIARSKLATGAADHVLIHDGSGALTSEAHLAVARGGTGQSTYANGEILIGKTDGTLAKSTLTAGTGISITNGDGTITINGSSGTLTSVTAGAGLTGGTITSTGTIGLDTELAAVNALSTTGFVQRTGAGAYSTLTGNTAASNNTVVTRDGSGVSGFYGVDIAGATSGAVTLTAPSVAISYVLRLPANAGTNGYVLQTDGSGNTSWVAPSAGSDNLGNHTATQNIQLGSNWLSGDGGNEGLRIDAAGNIGMGTSSPSYSLDLYRANTTANMRIASDNTSTTTARYPALLIENFMGSPATDGGGSPSVSLINYRGTSTGSTAAMRAGESIGSIVFAGSYNTSGSYKEGAAIWARAAENYTSTTMGTSMHFYTASSGSGSNTEKMTLSSTGELGVGRTSPVAKLDVNGGVRVGGDATCTAAKSGMIAYNSSNIQFCVAGSWVPLATSGGDFKADGTVSMTGSLKSATGSAAAPGLSFAAATNVGLFQSSGNLGVATNGLERLTVLSNGNVGIGTDSPSSLLTVNGQAAMASAVTTNFVVDGPAAGWANTTIRNTSADGYSGIGFVDNTGNSKGYVAYANSGAGITPGTVTMGTMATTVPLAFSVGGFEVMRMAASTGNVGVGTTTPASKLQVNGTISNTVQTTSSAFTCGSSGIDFATGNFQRLNPSNTIAAGTCGVIIGNLVPGAIYTLVVTGNAATNAVTYQFSGYTFKYRPINAATTAGKDTIYRLVYDGVTVYVSWEAGY